MARRMVRRLLVGATFLLVVTAISPAPAAAVGPDQITITGDDLPEQLVVRVEEHPDVHAALYSEVNWLTDRPSQADKPDQETLGPSFQLEVYFDGEARYRFNLYPLAAGGPRAHRPAKQPGDRKTRSGWFYGRLSMPDTLASAGVPLTTDPVATGGIGGGDPVPDQEPTTAPQLSAVLDEWREGLRLTAVVIFAIVIGLAGVALLIRRRV